MPDLLAGSKVLALDTPPTVEDTENGQFDVTSTTPYGVTSSAGTYVDCGVAFVAPTTGRVLIHYKAQASHSTTSYCAVSPVVREGGTVGSGTTVLAADDVHALILGPALTQAGQSELLSGLTPGDTYNVRLEHRAGAATATFLRREVVVEPAT